MHEFFFYLVSCQKNQQYLWLHIGKFSNFFCFQVKTEKEKKTWPVFVVPRQKKNNISWFHVGKIWTNLWFMVFWCHFRKKTQHFPVSCQEYEQYFVVPCQKIISIFLCLHVNCNVFSLSACHNIPKFYKATMNEFCSWIYRQLQIKYHRPTASKHFDWRRLEIERRERKRGKKKKNRPFYIIFRPYFFCQMCDSE